MLDSKQDAVGIPISRVAPRRAWFPESRLDTLTDSEATLGAVPLDDFVDAFLGGGRVRPIGRNRCKSSVAIPRLLDTKVKNRMDLKSVNRA